MPPITLAPTDAAERVCGAPRPGGRSEAKQDNELVLHEEGRRVIGVHYHPVGARRCWLQVSRRCRRRHLSGDLENGRSTAHLICARPTRGGEFEGSEREVDMWSENKGAPVASDARPPGSPTSWSIASSPSGHATVDCVPTRNDPTMPIVANGGDRYQPATSMIIWGQPALAYSSTAPSAPSLTVTMFGTTSPLT